MRGRVYPALGFKYHQRWLLGNTRHHAIRFHVTGFYSVIVEELCPDDPPIQATHTKAV